MSFTSIIQVQGYKNRQTGNTRGIRLSQNPKYEERLRKQNAGKVRHQDNLPKVEVYVLRTGGSGWSEEA